MYINIIHHKKIDPKISLASLVFKFICNFFKHYVLFCYKYTPYIQAFHFLFDFKK
jgi:hypothetical protein